MSNKDVGYRLMHLSNGYMREQFATHSDYDQFEISLVNIIIELLGNIFMRFDIYPLQHTSLFSNYNTVFKRNKAHKQKGSFTFGCSYGMNKGVHKISIENKVNGLRWPAFGITTNIQYFKEHSAWFNADGKADISFLNRKLIGQKFCSGKQLETGKRSSTQFGVFDPNNCKAGDVISMVLNADEWTLTYELNDKQIGTTLNVIPNQTYYFFVSSNKREENVEYHIS